MIYTVNWSPDGALIVSTSGGGSEKTVQVWNAATGEQAYTYAGHSYWARAAAWSPDGKQIASGSFKEVQVWSAADGHKLTSFRGHEGWVRALAWSPGGKRIASTGEDKAVHIWDAARGRLIHTHRGHADWVDSLAWSGDGTRLASVDKDAVVQVWNVESSQRLPARSSPAYSAVLTYRAHPSSVHAVTWLPDDKHIAVACGDGSVQIWPAM
jgi:WD40 repeat protein